MKQCCDGDYLDAGDHARAFLYDGMKIVNQFDKAGNASSLTQTHRYLQGPSRGLAAREAAFDMLFADEQLTGSAGTLWDLGDNLGSVRDVVNSSSAVVDHIVYDSYGRQVAATSGAPERLHGFTGQPFDIFVSLQNNWHRWYDAEIGKWVSEDPIGFGGGDGNLYRYVRNLVNGLLDPSGLASPPGYLANLMSQVATANTTVAKAAAEVTAATAALQKALCDPRAANAIAAARDRLSQSLSSLTQATSVLQDKVRAVTDAVSSMAAAYPSAANQAAAAQNILASANAQAAQLQQLAQATAAIDPNKIVHIFSNAQHGLQPLLTQCGNAVDAYLRIKNAVDAYVAANPNLTGSQQLLVTVDGVPVTVTGTIVQGSFRIGTSFVKP